MAGDPGLGRDYVAARRAAGLAGGRAGELRRRRAGHAPPGDRQPARGPRPAGRSSSAPAACATSSSPCSCCSSCTAAPTSRCAARPRWTPSPPWPRRLRRPRRRGRAWPPRTGSCAASSTGSSCTGCAAPTRCPTTRPRCAGRPGAADCGRHGRAGRPRRASRADPAAELLAEWRTARRQVRRLHEKLFYRPLLEAVARLPGEAAADHGGRRRPAGGARYADPAGALRHIEALTAGVTRRAAIQRTLLPVMLGWFADAAQPDAGLLAFRQVSDALGRLALVSAAAPGRHQGRAADGQAAGLEPVRHRAAAARARRGGHARRRRPARARGGRRAARPRPRGRTQARPARRDAVAAVLALRRRELLRTATADLLGLSGVEPTGEALTAVTRGDRRRAGGGGQDGRGAGRPAAHPDVRGGHGPARRARDGLRQRRRCDVRARAAPGADEEAATRAAHAIAEELRRLLGRGRARPAAADRRRPAPRGTAGPAGPHAGLVPAPTTSAGPRPGRPRRCCAPSRSRATPRSARRFTALADELRYPGRGMSESLSPGGPPDQGPDGSGTPAPWRSIRPSTSSSARAGWPTWSGWCSCCSCATPHAVPALRTTRTLAALRPPRRGPGEPARRGGPDRGVAAGHPGPQRGDAGPRPSRGHGAVVPQPELGAVAGCSATRPTPPRTCCRITAGPPAGPAR